MKTKLDQLKGFIVVNGLCLIVLMASAVSIGFANAPLIPQPKGLLISPTVKYINVDTSVAQTSKIYVANNTSKNLIVYLNVKQFSVNNYSYTFQFKNVTNNWVTLQYNRLNLDPNQGKYINYSVNVPNKTAPGGYYYTFFTSANYGNSLTSTVQSVSLLYMTVNGKLIQNFRVINSSVQHIMFSSSLSYKLNILNTGNVYYFIYNSGALHGLSAAPPSASVAHLIIPNKIRTITGQINHPVLPGIYKASYGFNTESGGHFQTAGFIVYLPPWSISLVIVVILAVNLYYSKKRQRTKH